MLTRLIVALLVVSAALPAGRAQAPALTPPADTPLKQQAAFGIGTLQSWYEENTGLYRTAGWWNSANAITVLADYSRLVKSKAYYPVFANSLQQAPHKYKGFLNDYYDDEGWWALAWIDAYDLTHKREYLDTAQSIFTDMTGGWDATCGGGIWWSKDRKYKAAIANELFLSVAAHLAKRAPKPQRTQALEWAKKEWAWFQQSGMINAQGLVNDGLDTATCGNNGKKTWSYNQGVVIGGLAELSRQYGEKAVLVPAAAIASAATTRLVDSDGILQDGCEPKCGDDGVQFKGVFLRNLADLQKRAPRHSYQAFASKNAQSIWTRSQGPGYQFGQAWSGPFSTGDAGSQSSALDALVAASTMH